MSLRFSFSNRATALAVLLCLFFFHLSPTFAQDTLAQNGKEDSGGSVDLGRRGKLWENDAVGDSKDAGRAITFDDDGLGVFDAFFASLSMIIVSEIGDETFIIAALMAMRHPKSIVLSGALTALVVMTVLSTGLGRIVPNLISRKHTNSAATVLYAFFGLRLLYIAWRSSDSKSSQKKEMEEVEEKLESGQGKSSFRRIFSRFCTPIFLESFILTFLAEWGDRSQIATIALATHKNAVGVAMGATIGHTICTSLAVVGGSMLASKISQRTVAMVGGFLFLGFSLSSYFYPPLNDIICMGYRSWKYHVSQISVTNFLNATTPIHTPWRYSCSKLLHSTISYAPKSASRKPIGAFHASFIKKGALQTINLVNHLLTLYVKHNKLDYAQKLFDEIPHRDTHTWTILISGFARTGSSVAAFDLFREMQEKDASPNHYTLSSVSKCCSAENNLSLGKEIHGWILRNGVGGDVVLKNSILDLYLKCKAFGYAERFFNLMNERDVVSWNIMIGAYLRVGDAEKSLEMFNNLPYKDVVSWNTIIDGLMQCGYETCALEQLYCMVEHGTEFTAATLSIALILTSSLSLLEIGKQLHGQALKYGFNCNGFVRSSLVEMYCKCGRTDKASIVLRDIPLNSLRIGNAGTEESNSEMISWSSMVSGYVWNGKYEDALKSFKSMVRELVVVEIRTVTTIISACASAGILEFGQQTHAYIQKIGHRIDAYVGSSLIDMYSKSGSLDDSWKIFRQILEPNVVLWTSMISSCALHSQGRQAISLFDEMLKQGILPNEVTFLGVLNACSHVGLLEEGCKYFRMMKDIYHYNLGVEHCTSMVDLYGRAGRLIEAKNFIFENGISHLTSVWKSLLSSCRLHKNFEMGKRVSDILLQLAPSDPGAYVLLSNMCSSNHRWDEAAKLRSLMHQRGVKKQPGQSWIQLRDQIHTFVMGDRSHPQDKEIYSYLDNLIGRLKEIGYSLDANLVMQDVEEEQGEVLIGHHSEKLAVVFGIINTAPKMPIRIMKNLRICTDCHKFIKYASQLLEREIIVRDIHRFHHFRHGHCSCGDYW
ncbi:putative pentatricopeptide repeat-containing protein At3g23330 [Arachis ipaensis]|uniref:pentatricopeptide repeat-containing protein At5g04780, mitochondrial n=1 Tax=Arachis hypogaea TaxID=3818 RepID=UPI0007AFE17E|nr:putative pentatricopeptide repeat-containing protein At3g23330 [Arachis ipaensis]XP_025648244.1 putative pentatricopeptide repeat-containing protein At3g23330 [Arachis hypogaea]